MDVAARKRTNPGPAGFWKDMCFRFCSCDLSAVTTAISEATYHARLLPGHAPGRPGSTRRANILQTRTPIVGLHR